MKRKLFFCAVLVLFLAQASQAAMTYGADNYRRYKARMGALNYNVDPLWQFMNEIETVVGDGAFLLLDPGTAPTGEEGMFYADSSSHVPMYHNGTSWITIGLLDASSYNLDTAYNNGSTMDVDGDAVTLTVGSSDNNRVLDLVQNDTSNNPEAMRITNTGSGDTLAFVSTGGKDIDGTSSSWSVTHAGVGSFLGLVVGASDITLENAEFLDNGTNNKFIFDSDTGTVEDFAISLGANTNIITFSSGSGADTIEYGTLDDVNGVGNIYFDSAASQITLAANETADDLLIQVTGAYDASLDLRSAGTGADAIKMYASAGGIDIDAVADTIHIQNATTGDAEDITIALTGSTNSSIILASAGNAGNAIDISTSNANGDIKILSTDMIDIDAVDDITVDVSGAGANFDVDSGAGSIYLDAGEAAANAIVIDASETAGGIDMDCGTGGFDLTATGGDIVLQNTSTKDIVLDATAGRVLITASESAADSIILYADGTNGEIALKAKIGGLDFDAASGDITIDAAGAAGDEIIITNTDGTAAGAIALEATAGGITAVFADDKDLDFEGGQFLFTGNHDTANTIKFHADAGTSQTIVLLNDEGTGAAAIGLTATAGGITLNAGSGGVVFTTGQTRQYVIRVNDVDLDGSEPPSLTSLGTDARWRSDVLSFDTNPGGNDDVCYIQWIVPAGYIEDSADLHVYWTHSNEEDAADECDIDGTVDACAVGETTDAAGTVMAAVTSVITDASSNAGKLVKTSLDIEVEDIIVGDMVTIMFFFDESASLMATSGTADVHYFIITYESSE